jgi:hypothetical protein
MAGEAYAQVFDSGSSDTLDTTIPQGTFVPHYKIHVMRLIEAFNASITGNVSDLTPRLKARSCIVAILDQRMKDDLLTAYDDELKRIDALTITNDKKGEMIIYLSQNAVSKVYDWLDVDMGLWHRLQIGKI